MGRTFIWTPAKERALDLMLAGRLTQARIAEELGTTRRTVEGWVRRTAFRERRRQRSQAQVRRWMAARKRNMARERAAREDEAQAWHNTFMADLERRRAACGR